MNDTVSRYFVIAPDSSANLSSAAITLLRKRVESCGELAYVGVQLKNDPAVGEAVLVLLAMKKTPSEISSFVGCASFSARDVLTIASRAVASELLFNLREIKRCD